MFPSFIHHNTFYYTRLLQPTGSPQGATGSYMEPSTRHLEPGTRHAVAGSRRLDRPVLNVKCQFIILITELFTQIFIYIIIIRVSNIHQIIH